jgi:hypothetical protein
MQRFLRSFSIAPRGQHTFICCSTTLYLPVTSHSKHLYVGEALGNGSLGRRTLTGWLTSRVGSLRDRRYVVPRPAPEPGHRGPSGRTTLTGWCDSRFGSFRTGNSATVGFCPAVEIGTDSVCVEELGVGGDSPTSITTRQLHTSTYAHVGTSVMLNVLSAVTPAGGISPVCNTSVQTNG